MKRIVTLLMLVCTGCMSDALAEEPGGGGDYGIIEGGGNLASGGTVEDDNLLCWGTDCDTWLEWDTTTTPDQLSLNNTDCDGGGTDCVIWYTEVGSPNLFLGSTSSLVVPTGTKVYFNSATGGSIDDGGVNGRLRLTAGAAQVLMTGSQVTLNASSEVVSIADFRAAADASVTGELSVTGGRTIAVRIIDVDDTPYTVVATDEVIIVDTDSGTGAPAAVTVNLPAAACGITIGGTEKSSCKTVRISNIGGTSNVTVDANASEEIDAATTQTVTPGGSLTLLDINQTNYHWKIQ